MKTFLAIIACIAQMFIVLLGLTWLRGAVSAANSNAILNVLFMLAALADTTVINYWIWITVRPHSAPR